MIPNFYMIPLCRLFLLVSSIWFKVSDVDNTINRDRYSFVDVGLRLESSYTFLSRISDFLLALEKKSN